MARRTALHPWHGGAGARFVEFGGWEMPLQYRGIVEEHLAVRSAAGLFDVSHMGKLLVSGAGARDSLRRLSTNDIPREPGRARYTHILDAHGAILDDVIVTCIEPVRFLVVCNAGPRERIVPWVRDHIHDATLDDLTDSTLCLALQGPKAAAILQRLTPADLTAVDRFGAAFLDLGGPPGAMAGLPVPAEVEGRGAPRFSSIVRAAPRGEPTDPTPFVLATRTGYTGEDGFELFPSVEGGIELWSRLLEAGGPDGLVPVGLGARDTLRLEKGYLLSGQDFTGRETPLEAGTGWVVKWGHDFIGRAALEAQRARGGYSQLLGLRMLGKGIPRHGCPVLRSDAEVGTVSSGTFSPSLRIGIALAYLEPDAAVPGARLGVAIRDAVHPAEVVKPPFL